MLYCFFFFIVFTFSYNYMVKKVLFLCQIFEIEFLKDLYILRAAEFKISIFSGYSNFLCVCDFYNHNSNTEYSRNSKFLYLHHKQMDIGIFYKNWANSLCTGVHKRISYILACGGDFLFLIISIFRLH